MNKNLMNLSSISLSNTTTASENIFFMPWILEMVPIICILGVITNLTNIIVFLNPLLHDRTFKYMLANSISDLIYLSFFITDFYFLGEFCTKECPITGTFAAQMFFFLVDDYFSSVCAFFCLLVDIVLSLERLFLVKNKPYLTQISQAIVIPVCIVISLGKFFSSWQIFTFYSSNSLIPFPGKDFLQNFEKNTHF